MNLADLARRESLFAFIPLTTPSYTPPFHLRPYVQAIEDAVLRGNERIIAVAPRRHGKSETMYHACAWAFLRNPSMRIGYAAYGMSLSTKASRAVRSLCVRAGVEMDPTSRGINRWHTKEGGLFLATSIGGALVGYGFDLLVIDDPIKDAEAAESPVIREATWEWFTSSAYPTATEPGSSCIVFGTRWHVDDLVGRLQALGDDWRTINLPALNDKGEALWPEKYPIETLERIRRGTLEYNFSAQYLGKPIPRGGRVFEAETRYDRPQIGGSAIVIGCDPAVSEKTAADFSAVVVLAMRRTAEGLYAGDVLEVFRGQVAPRKLCDVLEVLQQKYKAPVYVEAVGVGRAIPELLKAVNPKLVFYEVPVNAGKLARATPVAAAWNDKRVRVPADAQWLRPFLAEVSAFTGVGDVHDDQVDALAHAWNAIALREPAAVRGVREGAGPFG